MGQFAPEEVDSGISTVLRGVIDLAFREHDGWVVVDYKTDMVSDETESEVVAQYKGQVDLYARCWEMLIEEGVSEKGLFFTTTGKYVSV